MTSTLVTGGAGFIGSHLVQALLERGDTVRVLDNFSTGRPGNLPHSEQLEIHQADLRDPSALAKAVHNVDFVFHLAAFISVPLSMTDPETCFAVNVNGTIALFEAARRAGVKKVVIASSTAVYGDTRIFPTGEDAPLDPLSPYALSKQVTELYARLYTQSLGLPVIALRYFNVYGPRQRPNSDYAAAIPIFLGKLLSGQTITIFGDGRQTRDFIFVKDVVDANLLAASSEAAGLAINVCTGREASILDLLEEISQLVSKPAGTIPPMEFGPARPGDVYRSIGDPAKAASLLRFTARTPLSTGLQQTIDWMRSTQSHA